MPANKFFLTHGISSATTQLHFTSSFQKTYTKKQQNPKRAAKRKKKKGTWVSVYLKS